MTAPMLKPFGPAIWTADGPEAVVIGFRFPTRMVVIQLGDGGLFVCSPVSLSAGLKSEVDALGEVRHLVAPNSLHHLFLGEWRQAYPEAKLHAPPGLRAKRRDLDFDHDLEDAPPAAWAADVDQVLVRGNTITTEVVFFHRQSRTVLFTDLIQHFRADRFSGWRAVVARLDLMTAPEPTVLRKFRAGFIDRGAARVVVQRILAWPCEKVLMAHGAPIEADGQAAIARAFRWLRPNTPHT